MENTRPTIKTDEIKCPGCGARIPISETLRHQLTEETRKELQEELAKQRQDLSTKEEALQKKEQALASAEKNIDKAIQEKLEGELEKLREEANKKAREDQELELKDLKAQVEEGKTKVKKAQERELDLLRKERDLEDAKKALEVELAKKLEVEKKKIAGEIESRINEERRLTDAEKDKKITDLLKQMEEWKRKAQQGSQQAQGEVSELELEDFLRTNFPTDAIQPVPKGMTGADVLQLVHTRVGNFCGTVIWESKRTKNWSDGWIQKLKDDQRAAKADVAVLVTEALPSDIRNFGQKEGIWITTYPFVLGLATALRATLTQVAMTKLASRGKNEKIEVLFNYLTGPEFRQRVEAIVETFAAMQGDLEKEKRTFQTQWAKREKHIRRVLDSTSGMYGDLQGLVGSSMQSIPALEAGTTEEEVNEEE